MAYGDSLSRRQLPGRLEVADDSFPQFAQQLRHLLTTRPEVVDIPLSQQ